MLQIYSISIVQGLFNNSLIIQKLVTWETLVENERIPSLGLFNEADERRAPVAVENSSNGRERPLIFRTEKNTASPVASALRVWKVFLFVLNMWVQIPMVIESHTLKKKHL